MSQQATRRFKFIVAAALAVIVGSLWMCRKESRGSLAEPARDPHMNIVESGRNNCGPAALKMIFGAYGIAVTLTEIENAVRSTSEGTSMLSMQQYARSKGLWAQGWKLNLKSLSHASYPVILFVREGHFIVADSLSADRTLYVRDPAWGTMALKEEALNDIWQGETLVFANSKTK